MEPRWISIVVFGTGLALSSGCPEPRDDAADASGDGSDTSESSSGATAGTGSEDVRPPGDEGDEDDEGDDPFDPLDRCWDRQLQRHQLPAELFDSTIGRNDDSLASCAIDPSPDLQVGFIAPFAGTFVFDSSGSGFDTVVSVANDECGAELACNDDFIGLSSRVLVALDGQQAVTVTVDGAGPLEQGPVKLTVTQFESPSCEPGKLSLLPEQVMGDTSLGLSERESGCGGGGAPEQMFEFAAPGPGLYRLTTAGSSFDTVLYLLDECDALPFACNDDVGLELHSTLTVALTSDEKILVVVDGHDEDDLGEFVLSAEAL